MTIPPGTSQRHAASAARPRRQGRRPSGPRRGDGAEDADGRREGSSTRSCAPSRAKPPAAASELAMRYREPVFRPPSEAHSYLLHVTYGCSHNECTYCAMYRTKKFEVRPLDQVLEDIEAAGRAMPETRRVFLLDGDALTLATKRLMPRSGGARGGVPRAPARRCVRERRLDPEQVRRGLRGCSPSTSSRIGYLGLESGDPETNAEDRQGRQRSTSRWRPCGGRRRPGSR